MSLLQKSPVKETLFCRECMYEYTIMISRDGVATISRLFKIIGLFCRISSLYRALLQIRPIILRSLLIVATPYHDLFHRYEVASISRLLQNIDLFCKRAL